MRWSDTEEGEIVFMKDGKIQIALIGAGRAGMIHAVNFKHAVDGAELYAIADANEQAAAEAAKKLEVARFSSDYKIFLNDDAVDAVIVVTPTKFHCEIVCEAAAAGKHILCEKPMAMDEFECDVMAQAADRHNVILQLAFMRRYDRSFIAAKKAIEEGTIGEVVMVRSNTRGPSIPKPWMYDISKSNGPLAEVNSHDIDTLRWFTGSEFESVYAIAGNYRCLDARQDFPDFYDNVCLIGKFINGMQGIIDGAQGVQYGYDARCEILGTRGCLYLGHTEKNSLCICTNDGKKRGAFVNSWRDLFKDAYLAEDQDFAACIQEGRSPAVSALDGKMAVRIVNAGNKSIKEKRVVILGGNS